MADFYGVWYQGFCTNCADLNTWAYAPKDLCFTNVPGSSPPTCGLASFKDCSPAGRCEAGECMVSSGAGGAGRGCMHGCVLTRALRRMPAIERRLQSVQLLTQTTHVHTGGPPAVL